MKRFIQRNLKRIGVDIRSSRHTREVIDFLTDRKIDVVLDVGANIGQFGEFLRLKGYREKIISFEPIRSVFETLSAKARADGNWETQNFALGSAKGTAVIHVSEFSVFSSILTQTPHVMGFDTRAISRRAETIEVRTLDDVAQTVSGNILLKIDTQGYERQVLEGGTRVLGNMGSAQEREIYVR